MNILLVAEEAAGVHVLRALGTKGHRIVAVMTSTRTNGPRAAVADAAGRLGLPTVPAERVREPAFAEFVRAESVDLLLNVHSLYRVAPQVLDAPRIGAFNVHPGPLPRYAGLNAPSWAILRGERNFGVTVHWMISEIDAGPIAYQTLFEIGPADTGLTLSTRCALEGVKLVLRLVESAATNPASVPSVPQDLSLRERFGKEVPRDGALTWHQPSREIVAFVRAFDYYPFTSPWGHPRATRRGEAVGILRAEATGIASQDAPGTVGNAPKTGVHVAATDEWVRVGIVHHGGAYARAEEVLRPGDILEDGGPAPHGLATP